MHKKVLASQSMVLCTSIYIAVVELVPKAFILTK